MVQGYREDRYYRRGQYRAVPMAEHEVRDRYERLASRRAWLETFMESRELNYVGDLLPANFRSQYVICPVVPRSLDWTTEASRGWLQRHPYGQHFEASAYGVRTPLIIREDSQRWEPYTEIYRNGAISHWRNAHIGHHPQRTDWPYVAYVAELEKLRDFLNYGGQLFQSIEYSGPIHLRVEISHSDRRNMPKVRLPLEAGYDWPLLITHDNTLRMSADESAMTLISEPRRILKKLADEMFRAFGSFEATCFDGNLNLVSRR